MYGRPVAPANIGITRLDWPRTLVPRGVELIPEVRLYNFGDEPMDVDVEVEFRIDSNVVYTSTQAVEGLEADRFRSISFDGFVPGDQEAFVTDVSLRMPGRGAWTDAADIDGDAWTDLLLTRYFGLRLLLNESGTFVDHSELLVDLAEQRLRGPSGRLRSQWVDLDGDGDLDVYSPWVIFENLGTSNTHRTRVEIDVRPGNNSNGVNPSSHGVILVAVLGSESFDVGLVAGANLVFGPGMAPLAHRNGPHLQDVNADGFADLIYHFRIPETAIFQGDTWHRRSDERITALGGSPL